jgi:hypothetical protein
MAEVADYGRPNPNLMEEEWSDDDIIDGEDKIGVKKVSKGGKRNFGVEKMIVQKDGCYRDLYTFQGDFHNGNYMDELMGLGGFGLDEHGKTRKVPMCKSIRMERVYGPDGQPNFQQMNIKIGDKEEGNKVAVKRNRFDKKDPGAPRGRGRPRKTNKKNAKPVMEGIPEIMKAGPVIKGILEIMKAGPVIKGITEIMKAGPVRKPTHNESIVNNLSKQDIKRANRNSKKFEKMTDEAALAGSHDFSF